MPKMKNNNIVSPLTVYKTKRKEKNEFAIDVKYKIIRGRCQPRIMCDIIIVISIKPYYSIIIIIRYYYCTRISSYTNNFYRYNIVATVVFSVTHVFERGLAIIYEINT